MVESTGWHLPDTVLLPTVLSAGPIPEQSALPSVPALGWSKSPAKSFYCCNGGGGGLPKSESGIPELDLHLKQEGHWISSAPTKGPEEGLRAWAEAT